MTNVRKKLGLPGWVACAVCLVAACGMGMGALASCSLNAETNDLPASEQVGDDLWVDDKARDQPLPAWCAVEGDTLKLAIDESLIESAYVYNYPFFGPEGRRALDDRGRASEFLALVNDRTFTAAQTVAAHNEEQKGLVGGYSSIVAFLDRNGDDMGTVSYNPSYPGDGVAVVVRGVIYTMDGDQTPVAQYFSKLVDDLRDQGTDPNGGAAVSGASYV